MPRHAPSRAKPFSGKQKKLQLQEKRQRKRGDADADAADEGDGVHSAPVDGTVPSGSALVESLGKGGEKNRWSTVFVRENDADVEARRIAADAPLDTALRGRPIRAQLPLHDAVLDHPRGVGLSGGGLGSGSDPEALREAESTAFRAWLDGVFAHYEPWQLTSFEMNLEVWMQLWHTLATAHVIVLVTDVRNPLWHVHPSLYRHVVEEMRKPLVILLNKTDLVSQEHVDHWLRYLRAAYPGPHTHIVPFSACAAAIAPGAGMAARRRAIKDARGRFDAEHVGRRARDVVRLLEVAGVDPGPVEAVRRLILATTKEGGSGTKRQVAAAAAGGRPAPRGAGAGGHAAPATEAEDDDDDDAEDDDGEEEEGDGEGGLVDAAPASTATAPAAAPGAEAAAAAAAAPPARAGGGTDIIIGMVGHPNVGKSSVINTVCAAKRVSVSRTAGHTKRAQTIPVVPGVQLLDCPGLVFPRALVPRPTAAPLAAAAAAAPQAAVEAAAASASFSAAPAEGPAAVQPPPPPELGVRPVVMPRVMTAEERAAAAHVRRPGAAAPSAAAAALYDATAPLPAYLSHGAATAATTGEAVERAMQQLCGVISLAQVREPYTAVRYLAERMPLEAMYGLRLPADEAAWSPLLLCETLAAKRGVFIAKTGRPDSHAAGREILYDTQDGNVPLAWLPPLSDSTPPPGAAAAAAPPEHGGLLARAAPA